MIIGRRATVGEFEGDGVVPLRGSAEPLRRHPLGLCPYHIKPTYRPWRIKGGPINVGVSAKGPRGELDSPLEVSRLCGGLRQGIYETGHKEICRYSLT
jgi:hypothetical protein